MVVGLWVLGLFLGFGKSVKNEEQVLIFLLKR